jgi:hypothetical protein
MSTAFPFQLQLQNFLLFLLKCERGQEVGSLSGLKAPEWWPEDILFHDEILQKSSKKGVRRKQCNWTDFIGEKTNLI